MLNEDYKILISILVHRLNKIAQLYIQQDQEGFIQGWQARDNICRFCNIMSYTQESQKTCSNYFFDAEKVFDRVQWDFMKKVLDVMGFGPIFQTWVNCI